MIAQAEDTPGRSSGPAKIDLSLDKNRIAAVLGLTPVADPNNPTAQPTDAPFPVGRYVCETKLDGVASRTATFDIEVPPCPTAALLPNTACYGFYPEGQLCPRYGVTSSDGATCTCNKTKGWQCTP